MKSTKREITRRLHPRLVRSLSNRGLSITLNTFSGFDTEYDLLSSVSMQNTMLSAQVAVSTNAYITVPKNQKTSLGDIGCSGEKSGQLINCLLTDLDCVINDIRYLTSYQHDWFMAELLQILDKKVKSGELISVEQPNCNRYVIKSDNVSTFIKFTSSYSSDELVNDSDDVQRERHSLHLNKVFEILASVPEVTYGPRLRVPY